ncbi:MAG: sugar ABC transporter permease [Spirochaetaceae bacterium]|nr:MAG: sugar ABC transporter permease [Spirochaetaceae bacterium]
MGAHARRRFTRSKLPSGNDNLAGYIFMLPWLIGFLLLTAYPFFYSFYLSFTSYSLLRPPVWIGLSNYVRILTRDAVFRRSLGVTFSFVFVSVPLRLFVSLMIAMLLSRATRGMGIYRTAFYFPSLIGGSIAVAALWRNIFGRSGYINALLSVVGIEGRGWISHPDTALGTLILLNIWQFGSAMVIFLAGLKQIPAEMYESASIDGAGSFRRFIHITLPLLSPVIFFNVILGVINAFQMFTPAFIITQGGPVNSTYMYALYLYEKGFRQFQMGYASTLAWLLLMIVAVLTGVNFYLSKHWVYYESGGQGQ